MSSKNSALASLTATYTDSENEDDHNGNEEEESNENSSEPMQQDTVSTKTIEKPIDTIKPKPQQQIPHRPSKSNLRLVSYNDDLAISDDDISPNHDNHNIEISEEEDEVMEKKDEDANQLNDSSEKDDSKRLSKVDKFSEYGFSLPAEPKAKCPQELQDKIVHMYEKMKNGMDMNKVIQERKEFRNPSIYEKLIQFCDINELGTNYPNDIYDPLQWGKDSYYEELAKIQKLEMDKRDKERKEQVKQDLVVAAAKKIEEESKKRKSKWDQPAPGVPVQTTTKVASVVSFTSNATGTKGTVISAFGSLPKKPKA